MVFQEKRSHRLTYHLHLGGPPSDVGVRDSDRAAGGLCRLPGAELSQGTLSGNEEGEVHPFPSGPLWGWIQPNQPQAGQKQDREVLLHQAPASFLCSAGACLQRSGKAGMGISIPTHFKLLLLHLPSFALGCVLQDGSVSFQAVHCHRKRLSFRFVVQLEA